MQLKDRCQPVTNSYTHVSQSQIAILDRWKNPYTANHLVIHQGTAALTKAPSTGQELSNNTYRYCNKQERNLAG